MSEAAPHSQPGQALLDARQVHMVGIGGSGMSALASLLLQMRKQVSGSELTPGSATAYLTSAGATIYNGHAAEHVGDADYVVRSSAVPPDNVEVAEAERGGLTVRKLAEAVGELIQDRAVIAVAGTHGKTTTTALVAWLLEQGGLDPMVLIGADTPTFPQGAHLGNGPLVIEADEYDRRFLNYWPEVAIVTSVEADHLDYYRDLAEINETFAAFVARIPEHGLLIACADEPGAASLTSRARRETYGFTEGADWQIDDYVAPAGRGAHFTLRSAGRAWPVQSPLVGEHNACNVAAAIAVTDYFGIGLMATLAALPEFLGPRRRFETKGRPRGIWIVDDYGHHPTEVAAVLHAAATSAEGEVWIVFQPHTTNRTAALFDDFVASFADAQHALILPIYRPSGREAPSAARPVTSADIVEALAQRGHPDARFVESFDSAEAAIVAGAGPGDVVLTMGAGDVTGLSDRLVEALKG